MVILTLKNLEVHKSNRKGQHDIAPLNVYGIIINNSKDKAEAFSCQFQSVFTHEDLTHLPRCNDSLHPAIPDWFIYICWWSTKTLYIYIYIY